MANKNNPPLKNSVDALVAEFVSRRPLRSRSLLVTLFGDYIEPHGGSIWLGSMAKLVAPLGINERLVRTSLFRLQQDDWLLSRPVGRRSHYRLSEHGRAETAMAEPLIYDGSIPAWNRSWCLVFGSTPAMTASDKLKLKDALRILNFGAIAPNVYGHPNVDGGRLRRAIDKIGLKDKLVVMNGTRSFEDVGLDRQDMARFCCNYEEMQEAYDGFCSAFGDIDSAVSAGDSISDERSFLLRLLLVHEFRRIVLKDPGLPAELLPDDWSGDAARALASRVYRSAATGAARHFMEVCARDDEPVKPMSGAYADRFTRELTPVQN